MCTCRAAPGRARDPGGFAGAWARRRPFPLCQATGGLHLEAAAGSAATPHLSPAAPSALAGRSRCGRARTRGGSSDERPGRWATCGPRVRATARTRRAGQPGSAAGQPTGSSGHPQLGVRQEFPGREGGVPLPSPGGRQSRVPQSPGKFSLCRSCCRGREGPPQPCPPRLSAAQPRSHRGLTSVESRWCNKKFYSPNHPFFCTQGKERNERER